MKESVTAVFVNSDNEILIIKRHNHLRAFPGYTAFPGGKVDQDDRDKDISFSHDLLDHYEAYLVIALQRELEEELGLPIHMKLPSVTVKKE